MKYLAYSIVFVAVLLGVVLVPASTDQDVKFAGGPRFDAMTVQNVKLFCVDSGRCYDVRKLPARYRPAAEQLGISL